MGLTSILKVSNSGLTVASAGLDIVARNIANADTPGYTKKTLQQTNLLTPTGGRGVRAVDVSREVDEFLQKQVREQNSLLAGLDVRKQFLDRLDQVYGQPGEVNALDTIVNDFGESLQELITSPEAFEARQGVVGDAQVLAQQLNSLSSDIQGLRQLAEDSIATAVAEVNDALNHLVTLNSQLVASGSSTPPADLLDERDKFIDRLGEFVQINVVEGDFSTVSIRLKSGETLLEGQAVQLSFDQQGNIGTQTLYNSDPTQRGVGTIALQADNGFSIDLIATGVFGDGQIGTLIDLRDNVLVEAQTQLDELAHGLAMAFSQKQVAGTAAVVGLQTGFDVDTTGLQPGDSISLTYTDTATATQNFVTIIRVDDASQLPLSNDVTPDPNDTVIGIDFSAGLAAAAAAIGAALGGGFTVSSPGGNLLRIIDDGAGNTTDVDALEALIASTATQDDGLQIPLFIDGGNSPPDYKANFEGSSQRLGFAARIAVNSTIANNNELLVRHTSAPQTPLGDPDRPLELYARLAERDFTFLPASGIGETSNPYSGPIMTFSRLIVSYQGGEADRANRNFASQEVVITALTDRYNQAIGVDVDAELSDLLTLQNAYAANARVMQTASDLMEILLQL